MRRARDWTKRQAGFAMPKSLSPLPRWPKKWNAYTAAALAKEVERLCHDASRCNDSCEVEPLLATARERLLELQRLLGVH
jgi:hypothetical protein